jgi:xanthine/CO dehydrogenase XdhC/CoxF family maturation factor
MTTSRTIIDELNRAADGTEDVVLATVVRITGSSYGGVGTRMVIRPDGSTIGIVSGGCLEADLAAHAQQVHETREAKVVTYDTRADDDAAWGLGLGCNGLIEVLLEPLDARAARQVANLLQKARDADSPAVIATVIADPHGRSIGSHILIDGDVIAETAQWPSHLTGSVVTGFGDAFAQKRRGMVREYHGIAIAFEVVTPAIRLVICGSGPDVVPLVRFGRDLGWNLTVVDHRPLEHAHPERFPGANVVDCADAGDLARRLRITQQTAAVVMSHHYARDLGYMRSLLASEAVYIGMLGPRARTDRMLADLAASGGAIAAGERLHSPVGLDIGGEGPDAIALAIVSEVSAVISGSPAGHLRDSREALHKSQPAQTSVG